MLVTKTKGWDVPYQCMRLLWNCKQSGELNEGNAEKDGFRWMEGFPENDENVFSQKSSKFTLPSHHSNYEDIRLIPKSRAEASLFVEEQKEAIQKWKEALVSVEDVELINFEAIEERRNPKKQIRELNERAVQNLCRKIQDGRVHPAEFCLVGVKKSEGESTMSGL